MNVSNRQSKQQPARGVTLIELLVVVAILSVLTAIMIPRLRVINKDRNIREASRVVGSLLASVSARAIDEGLAGVYIERNRNFVDANGVLYAGTRMYAMRKLPPYAGDDYGDVATVVAGGGIPDQTMLVEIDIPLEQSATNSLIQIWDQMRLNNNSVIYDIIGVALGSPGKLELTLSLGLEAAITGTAVRPALAPNDYPFVIYRQPRKLESSRVDLPDGYYVDLRLSGPLVPTPSTPPTPPAWVQSSVFDSVVDGDVRLSLDKNGTINRWSVVDSSGAVVNSGIPLDAFYFFVAAQEVDASTPVADSPSAMWVSMDKSTGSVNVASNVPAPAGLTLFDKINYSRGFSKSRRSASQ